MAWLDSLPAIQPHSTAAHATAFNGPTLAFTNAEALSMLMTTLYPVRRPQNTPELAFNLSPRGAAI
jgi:hypothetical protein